MDPTVQVAAIGIISTIVSTLGVVIVAMVNKASPTLVKAPLEIEEDGDDDGDRESHLWKMILRRDEIIANLKAKEDLLNEELSYCRRNHHE